MMARPRSGAALVQRQKEAGRSNRRKGSCVAPTAPGLYLAAGKITAGELNNAAIMRSTTQHAADWVCQSWPFRGH